MAKKKLGLIQSRGLGDIVIALPIAKHFYDQGYEVLWPICEQFMSSVENHVPWVKWIPIPNDPYGHFFYEVPMQRLKNFKCDEIVCLYQALTGHPFHEEKYFQYTSFDQYKYIKAGVPFLDKWKLNLCITRDYAAEQNLFLKLGSPSKYAVIHLEGSDHTAQFDESIIPADWTKVYIKEGLTPSIFNWIGLLSGAEAIICVDSCIANMVDQLNLGTDRYFIARSHIGLTPVQGQDWTWLP